MRDVTNAITMKSEAPSNPLRTSLWDPSPSHCCCCFWYRFVQDFFPLPLIFVTDSRSIFQDLFPPPLVFNCFLVVLVTVVKRGRWRWRGEGDTDVVKNEPWMWNNEWVWTLKERRRINAKNHLLQPVQLLAMRFTGERVGEKQYSVESSR